MLDQSIQSSQISLMMSLSDAIWVNVTAPFVESPDLVIVLKANIRRKGAARLASRVAPLHQQLKLFGLKVPFIVAGAYIFTSILAIFAGYVGLISA
ncbi:hypothetical protein KSP40_PGU020569 [Platanthera guangdongensis]|uniref:Uncharacterized protein n=1 Tax=Platanthera guangdongensis TaxID=2320717 RepID=A0ABR2N3G4_9ASPA